MPLKHLNYTGCRLRTGEMTKAQMHRRLPMELELLFLDCQRPACIYEEIPETVFRKEEKPVPQTS